MSGTSGRRITYPEYVAQEVRAMLTTDGHAYESVDVDERRRIVVTLPADREHEIVAVF